MAGHNRLRDKDICKICGNPNAARGCKTVEGGMTICKNDGTGRRVDGGGYLHITPTLNLRTIYGRKVIP